jgi:4-hydroxyphenylpyruvate dioxygenase-like putative hemolysin
MLQAKFSVEEAQAHFLNNYRDYGFKDKSSMLRAAIDHLKKEIELERLKKSADLYSEIYSEDKDLKELTETAATEWPG